ncbi:hypothetical protein [Carnimonas bestiolae]|uniref:hypothetical protein n=1 Tax=Carnimonas bestiolae TaxID=3402172 RepID=UPI003EDC56E3
MTLSKSNPAPVFLDVTRKALQIGLCPADNRHCMVSASLPLIHEVLGLSNAPDYRHWTDRLDSFLMHVRDRLTDVAIGTCAYDLTIIGTQPRATVMRKRRLVIHVETSQFLNKTVLRLSLASVQALSA